MANKKMKRSLVLVVMSIVLCVAMLMGTTFAWFTDSEVSFNNIIRSGNLDIELEYSTDMKDWKTVSNTTQLFSDGYWEPGHTEVVYFRLVNLGSLALKYHFGINIVSEVSSVNVNGEPFLLSDYIYFDVVDEVKAPYANRGEAIAATEKPTIIGTGYSKSGTMLTQNQEQTMALVVYMPETVGNEANHKTGAKVPEITLGVNVFATQYMKEEDSFGDDYDEDALPCDIIATPETIDDILATAQPGTVIGLSDGKYGSITLTQDKLTLVSNTAVVDYINLNSKDDCKIIGITFDAAGAKPAYEMTKTAGVNKANGMYANIVGAENSATAADRVYIANCTFTGTPADVSSYVPVVFAERNRKTESMKGFTVTDCEFETSAVYYIYSRYLHQGLNSITNNVFGDYGTSVDTAIYSGNGKSNVTIAGNTFFNFGSAFTASAHSAAISPVVLTVKNNNFIHIAAADSINVIGINKDFATSGSSLVFEDNKANNGVDSFSGPVDSANGKFDIYTMNSSGALKPAYDQETLTSGGNLILTQDIVLTDFSTVIDKSTTILLNGHSITSNRNYTGSGQTTEEISTLFVTGKDTKLVIEGEGTVANTAPEAAYALAIYDDAVVTIKGGSFISYYDAIYVKDGELYVEGGFFQATEDTVGEPDFKHPSYPSEPPCHTATVINCYKAAYNNYLAGKTDGDVAKVVVTGGTFVNEDPANVREGDVINARFTADGYKTVSEKQANGEIWYTVIPD
ncbi:MAG: hypothetical protein E7599_06325 [Ruminococcaceae bacterium]|nr:hypothetical protein [Oscillospiraceae bacterium]